MINQTKYACWEGGLTFSTIPPCPVTNSMENSDIPYKSAKAYLKVPVISVYPSL